MGYEGVAQSPGMIPMVVLLLILCRRRPASLEPFIARDKSNDVSEKHSHLNDENPLDSGRSVLKWEKTCGLMVLAVSFPPPKTRDPWQLNAIIIYIMLQLSEGNRNKRPNYRRCVFTVAPHWNKLISDFAKDGSK